MENQENPCAAVDLQYRNVPDIEPAPAAISLVAEPTEVNTHLLRGAGRCWTAIDELGCFEQPQANAGIGDGLAPPDHATELQREEKRVLIVGGGDLYAQPTNTTESLTMHDKIITANETAASNETAVTERARLYRDEEWQREGNNKKWRSPAVEKNRKKMAKASKKRNRR